MLLSSKFCFISIGGGGTYQVTHCYRLDTHANAASAIVKLQGMMVNGRGLKVREHVQGLYIWIIYIWCA